MRDSDHGQAGPACPVHGHGTVTGEYRGPVLPGTGDTDYERYMRVNDLLALQRPADERAHPDEVMFQTIHQSWELWCSLVRFELRRVAHEIDHDDFHTAVRLLRRCRKALHANVEALDVFDTMVPQEFHAVRRELGQGSGAESPGFKGILADAPRLWPHVQDLLDRNSTTLERVYLEKGHRPDLFGLLEALTDVDEELAKWRQAHLSVVKRIIGRDVKSLKGYAVHELEDKIHHPLWPELWRVREVVTEEEGTSPA
jgi:tryptophan 2,3-dioxygenase